MGKSIKRRTGTITERRGKKGITCRIKFDLPVTPSGERRTVYKTIKGDRKAAERELRKMIAAAEKGVQLDGAKISLATWIAEWLQNHAKADISTRTFERYSELLNLHVAPRIGKIILGHLAPADIQKLYSDLLDSGLKPKPKKAVDKLSKATGLAPRTVIHVHRVLSRCLSDAARLRTIDGNPCRDVKPPKLNKVTGKTKMKVKMLILGLPDLGKLLDGIHSGAGGISKNLPPALATLALDSGARRGELLALRWTDFSHNARTIEIDRAVDDTKTDGVTIKSMPKNEASRRTVTISLRTAALLTMERHHQQRDQELLGKVLPADALIFPNSPLEPTNPLRPREVSKAFRRTVKALGFAGMRFHDMRHNCASHMIAAHRPIPEVSRQLGHASPAITMAIYAHAIPKDGIGRGLLDDIMPEKPGAVSETA